MLNALKNFKGKYQNSSSWKELLLSFVPGIEDIYKRLGEAKNDKERVELLNEALILQSQKIEELINKVQQLEKENSEKDLEIERLKENQISIISLNKLEAEERELSALIEQAEIILKIRK